MVAYDVDEFMGSIHLECDIQSPKKSFPGRGLHNPREYRTKGSRAIPTDAVALQEAFYCASYILHEAGTPSQPP